MGLNPRGRGRGGKVPFRGKGRRGGGMGPQGPPFRGGPPGMFGPPPMGFPPGPPFGAPPFFGGPPVGNFGPRRPTGFGKFPRKNFKGKQQQQQQPKSNETHVPEIDLTKPWVTEEIKTQDAKKGELLEAWRKSKDDNDWKLYKEQKQSVQNLYDQAKREYVTSHPEEAFYWIQTTSKSKNYYCDTCDKSFKTDEDLYLHEAEHETCGEEGCEFTAHPKIIERHIKMQHETGLYSRIGNLYSKEEIDKWIEERKKRYPSRKVIEEKKAFEEKKIERGERIKRDASRFNKSFTTRNRHDNKFEPKSVEKKSDNRKKERVKKKPVVIPKPTDENADWRGSIPPFAGIGKPSKPEAKPESEPEDAQNFTDDEWEETKTTKEQSTPVLSSSLNLLACYSSDEELSDNNNDSAPEEVKTITNKNDETVTNKPNETAPKENSSTAPKENSETTPDDDLEVSHERKIPGRRKRRHNRNNKNQFDKKTNFKKPRNERYKSDNQCDNNTRHRSLTLLEKLLSNEIRHERNVILQCVRYIVQNNFFKN